MTKSESGEDQEVATASPPLINSKNHGPGRELDALIAEKLFGALWYRSRESGRVALFFEGKEPDWFCRVSTGDLAGRQRIWDWESYGGIPRFSADISAAWNIVEKLAPHYIQQAFSRNEIGHWEIDWCVSEESYQAGYRTVVDYSSDYETHSLPHAICLAALRALDA